MNSLISVNPSKVSKVSSKAGDRIRGRVLHRMVRCAVNTNKSVFQLCPVMEPTPLLEIENCMAVTSTMDFKSKNDVFTKINVNYNHVVKWYPTVKKLEELYMGQTIEGQEEQRGIFDLGPAYKDCLSVEDIALVIVKTKKNNEKVRAIKFAAVNIDYDKVIAWYPYIAALERIYAK